MIRVSVRTEVLMGTIVTIQIVGDEAADAIERAFGWFREIESCCSRFDQRQRAHPAVDASWRARAVSPILFEAVRFALLVAEETGGAFDPTIGLARNRMASIAKTARDGPSVRRSRRTATSVTAMSRSTRLSAPSRCTRRC